jgi:hypothetical protein
MKNNGGPAFPCTRTEQQLFADGYRDVLVHEGGMSLRDYFAGQALIRTLGHIEAWQSPSKAAEWAYQFADAMLVERAK